MKNFLLKGRFIERGGNEVHPLNQAGPLSALSVKKINNIKYPVLKRVSPVLWLVVIFSINTFLGGKFFFITLETMRGKYCQKKV